MSILLVEKDGQGLQAAVMHRGKLYACRSESGGSLREGQVYSAVVDRVLKGVSAVFVRLPDKQFGFLPLSAGEKTPASGQRLIVQIKRPPTQTKKALLSTDIALAGDALVYLPRGSGVHVSSRIENAEEKATLRALGSLLDCSGGGVILRSAAAGCDLQALKQELDVLRARWQSILAVQESAPRLLWEGENMLAILLREERSRLEYILTNAPGCLPAALPCPVRTCDHPFLLHTVQHRLERSLRRTVQLKSGATLVIDPCEAMTVIDVNSAQAAVGKSIAETAEKINAEAAWEIARLLRLRGIGGMIVVDFIDMASEAAKERLLAVMREALSEDPEKTTVHDLTALGLMELTRHRAQTPFSPLPDAPCPRCGGSGIDLQPVEEDSRDA